MIIKVEYGKYQVFRLEVLENLEKEIKIESKEREVIWTFTKSKYEDYNPVHVSKEKYIENMIENEILEIYQHLIFGGKRVKGTAQEIEIKIVEEYDVKIKNKGENNMNNLQQERMTKIAVQLMKEVGDIKKATKEQIEKYAEKKLSKLNSTTKRTRIYLLNKVLEESGVDIVIKNDTKNDFLDISGVYTDKEVKYIIDSLNNPQDKFIIWGLYNGIYGTKAIELLSLKESDFNRENKTLKVGEKTINLDEYSFNIIKAAIEQKIYRKNIIATDARSNSDYPLNKKNPYIIKGKMTIKNNNGLDMYGYEGFRRRIRILGESTGVKLKPDALYISFIMNEMLKENIEFNTYTLKNWLKEKEYKANNELLLRKFNKKYRGN